MKLFVSVLILSLISINTVAQEQKTALKDLSWISGCWESAKKNSIGSERWTKPLGNMMLATSQTVANGKTVGFEYLRIVEDETGIYYISKPSENKEETAFKLIKFKPNEVIFENPTHDFPQRIIYRLEKDNSLFARIEGKNKGKEMGIDFPMKRGKCD